MRSENGVTCSPCKQDVSSQSGLESPYARQITRRSDDIPPHPRSMNTPHASYPIDRWCSSLKRKRAAPVCICRAGSASRLRTCSAADPAGRWRARGGFSLRPAICPALPAWCSTALSFALPVPGCGRPFPQPRAGRQDRVPRSASAFSTASQSLSTSFSVTPSLPPPSSPSR